MTTTKTNLKDKWRGVTNNGWNAFALAAALIATAATTPASTLAKETNAVAVETSAKPIAKLTDGLYLILREAESKEKVQPIGKNERIVINDYEFLDPSERETPKYIAVSGDSFIPFIFSVDPAKGKDDKGRTKLLLQLADDQIKPLEDFTRTNCGKSVAIIVGGKVVTTHKIREAITGGKLQITRCSDFGCDVLYTQLQKKPGE
jgi:preprotein translocase subunit SecD